MTRGGVFVAIVVPPALTIADERPGRRLRRAAVRRGRGGRARRTRGPPPDVVRPRPRRPRGRPRAAARPRPRPARRPLRRSDRCPAAARAPASTAPAFSIAASADRSAETATASRVLRAVVSARRNVTVSTDAILPRLGRLRRHASDRRVRAQPAGWVRDQTEKIFETGTTDSVDIKGRPVVLVTMRGAKSGKLRKVPLMRVEHDGDYAIVASLGGAPKNPVWYHNVKADPDVELQDGTVTKDYTAREVDRRGEGDLVGAGRRHLPRLRRLPAQDRPARSRSSCWSRAPPDPVGGRWHTRRQPRRWPMTADPVPTPEREPRLLTVAEYLALGETELGYDELVEGRVFMSPSPGRIAELSTRVTHDPQRGRSARITVIELSGGQLGGHRDHVDHRAVAQHRHRQRHADRLAEELALDALRVLRPARGRRRAPGRRRAGPAWAAGLPPITSASRRPLRRPCRSATAAGTGAGRADHAQVGPAHPAVGAAAWRRSAAWSRSPAPRARARRRPPPC